MEAEQAFTLPENFSYDTPGIEIPARQSLVQEAGETGLASEFETNARKTLLRMLREVPEFDKEFSFKTFIHDGKAHIQAMRTVLSRARSEADGKLEHFKLFVVSVETFPTHDLVTVMRSKKSSLKQKRAYGELISILRDTKGEDDES